MEHCTVIHLHGGVINNVVLFEGLEPDAVEEAIEDGYAGDCLKDEVVIHWPVTFEV
jgi:hypothetical protein